MSARGRRTRPAGAPALVLVAVLVAAASAGCSGSSPRAGPPPAPTTTVSLASLSSQYKALVAPVNTALRNFSYPSSATGTGLAQLAAPLISALSTFDQAAPKLAWPPKIRTDVDALIAADKVLEAHLRTAADQKTGQLTAWGAQLHTDGAKLNAAASVVLVDLGQPPLTTPTTRSATSSTSSSVSRTSPPTS